MPTELHGKIAACAADVRFLEDTGMFQAAYSAVSEARRKRVDRVVSAEDKRLLLGAELLLRLMLAEAGVCTEPPEFVYGGEEKPYLKNREDVFFNLSHSGSYVLCVLSDAEIGCDIERIRDVNINIAKRHFCPEEYEHLISLHGEEARRKCFFRYWTLKESFLKATGRGLRLPMNAFLIDTEGEQITVRQNACGGEFSFSQHDEIPGYCCAICVCGARRDCTFKTADLRSFFQETERKET